MTRIIRRLNMYASLRSTDPYLQERVSTECAQTSASSAARAAAPYTRPHLIAPCAMVLQRRPRKGWKADVLKGAVHAQVAARGVLGGVRAPTCTSALSQAHESERG